mmetsp:Transcript_35268/g.77305  ORF Transcript_35268/g.77305 Transcript_35268/m.77305 type:complete len:200 (-) Transcript_35268:293-892(-)
MIVIDELIGLSKVTAKMAANAWRAPPATDPPSIRIGLIGGDIPVAPPLAMLGCVLGGFGVSAIAGMPGVMLQPIVPENYYLPTRLFSALIVVGAGSRIKRECDKALAKAGTEAEFKPVPSVANTGPYAMLRNPMYVAILAFPSMLGLAFDNAWVTFGSNAVLWLYLNFVVVPTEERFLRVELGEAYKKYAASVKRWGIF